jgi:hypothetical protein
VNAEPVLDMAATLEIIRRTHPFVDLYKVGQANYLSLTETADWKQFTHDVLRVLAEVGARHYIKKDLQPYLPASYDNPMRVKQVAQPANLNASRSCGKPRGTVCPQPGE